MTRETCRPFTGNVFDVDVYDCPCGHIYGVHDYYYDQHGMQVNSCSGCSGRLATLVFVDCPCGHGEEHHFYRWDKPFFVNENPKPRCAKCRCRFDLHTANTRMGYAIFEFGCGLVACSNYGRQNAKTKVK